MPSPFNTFDSQRDRFAADLIAFLGAGNVRVLVFPEPGDTTTTTDRSVAARTVTWNTSIANRLNPLGMGLGITFGDTTDYGTIPDAANLSFGDGSTDSAFSLIVLANVTNSAATRELVVKSAAGATNEEYRFFIDASDLLLLSLTDNSTSGTRGRTTSAAITMGAYRVFAATYVGSESGNGIRLYQNGAVLTSTATSSSSYTAMENLTGTLNIGSNLSSYLDGRIALVLLVAAELSPAAIYWVSRLILQHHGLV